MALRIKTMRDAPTARINSYIPSSILSIASDSTLVKKAIEKTSQLEEMLASVDPKDLKETYAKDMLESIKQMLVTK